jgi:hypothetical protein
MESIKGKKDKIKGKIKALLAKTTDSGATKEEMESALSKANQLMTEFFISEHELQDTESIKLEKFELTKSGFDLTYFYADLAFLFDCEYYYSHKNITFFGHEQDVALCGYFYNVISRTCLKEKDIYLKSENYKQLSRQFHGRTLAASFIKGFLVQIVYKMQEMYAEKEKNVSQSTGVVIFSKKEKVKSEFNNLNLTIRTEKEKQIKGERSAFTDGYEKGKDINISKGIDTYEKSNRLALN